MPKSSFTLSRTFKPDIKKLRIGVLTSAETAMSAGIELAELEARENARWADTGGNSYETEDTRWTWDVTGMSRAAIAGYAVSKNLKPKLPTISMPSTRATVNGRAFKAASHTARPPKTASAEMNKVKAILTRYGKYAGYLEARERDGTTPDKSWSANPIEAGVSIIEQVMARWRSFFVPTVVVPQFRQQMARVISTLGK